MATFDILLPVKNCAAYFSESIQSLIDQTCHDWRLLILDHGSTDGSLEIAQTFAKNDPRIEVHQFLDAVGLSDLLNRGLTLCNCQFVMRHDADDIAMPDRMQKTLDAFAKYPDVSVIGGHALKIDASGKETGLIKVPTAPDRLQAAFFFKNPMIHPTVSIRFSTITQLGIQYGIDFVKLFPESKRLTVTGLAEDYYLFGQLGVLGQCLNIDEVLIKYRWHGENVGAKKFLDQIQLSIEISRYLAELFCIKNKVQVFDPAPFCTYGGTILNIVDKSPRPSLAQRFNQMALALKKVIGVSAGLERELAFRRILTSRTTIGLLMKFVSFKFNNQPDLDEWYAVKSWVTRKIKYRQLINVILSK